MRKAGVLLSVFVLQGCASILSGTSQEITINSEPEGANCSLSRNNVVLRRFETPATFEIKKTKYDLTIKCEHAGYYPETVTVDSEIQGATWGNIILGGGIGWAIDSARGADNRYADAVLVRLTPLDQEHPAAPADTAETNEQAGAEDGTGGSR